MRHNLQLDKNGSLIGVSYEWALKRKRNCLELVVKGQAVPAREGSEEEFITEHYWGYARQRDGGTLEYQVKHPKWRVWPVQPTRLDCDVGELYGDAFIRYLAKAPNSAFLAEGSAVTVLKGKRIA